MSYIISLLQTVGPFFLLLGLLIFIHELGHFSVARFFGVRVETFSIGFGKKILKFKHGDTEYRISIFPFGGFVKMFGDNPLAQVSPEEQKYSFIHKPVSARIAIVLAGPLMNLVLAFFVFFGIGLYGEPQISAELGDISEVTAAYKAGLRSGDRIISVNGTQATSYDNALKLISEAGSSANIEVLRNKEKLTFDIPTEIKSNPNILSSEREIPQIEGLTMYSSLPLLGLTDSTSSWAQAGLQSLDQIKEINSQKISTTRDFKASLESLAKESSFKVTFSREVIKEKSQAKTSEQDAQTNTENEKIIDGEIVKTVVVENKNLTFESTEMYVGRVQPGSPAEKMGLKRGDKILEISGTPVNKWETLIETVKAKGTSEQTLDFKVLRNYETLTVSVKPIIKSIMNEKGQETFRPIVGIEPALYIKVPDQIFVPAGGFLASISYAAHSTWKWSVWTINSILRVVQGEVSHKNLGGFITIGQVAKESFKVGWSYFFQMMGIISINLFLLNLFPIPVLDGGHLVFYTIEALRGKPVSPQKMEIAFMFGFAVLMSLVGLTLFNDIQRVFLSGW